MEIRKFEDRWMGENTYVVTFDGCKDSFVIDPAMVYKDVEKYIRENELNVKYIILTHSHSDHIADVKKLQKLTDAKIVAHEEERDLLTDADKNLSKNFLYGAMEFEADTYVSEKDTMEICGEKITFMHTPGHTKGGMCVRVGMDMFTGDTLFAGEVGRTDLYSGNYDELLNSLKRLSELEHDLRVHPGHGPSSTIGDERKINRYMRLVL